MPSPNASYNAAGLIFWMAAAIVAAVGVYLHFADLDLDPPMYFAGRGQSLSTDPYHFTYFSRNKLLFDEWELFDSARWRVFEVGLVSGLSYIIFSIFGISRTAANATGLVLMLFSTGIFLLVLKRTVNIRAVFLALIFLLFNKALFVYGRLPYLENGMIFFMAVLFFVFVHFRAYLWAKIIIGILVALSGMAGKIFGYMIIVPVVLSYWIDDPKNRLRNMAVVLISCLAASAVWIFLVYGSDLSTVLSYFQAQSLGMYGFPDAFKSPVTFLERLISFGSGVRFYFHAPVLGVAGFIAFCIILTSFTGERLKKNVPLIFLIVWFVAGQLFFMPENYRPLRYIYMLYFPLAGIVACAYSDRAAPGKNLGSGWGYWRHILLFSVTWIFLYQLVYNIFFSNLFEESHRLIVWLTVVPALALMLLERRAGFYKLSANKAIGKYAIFGIFAMVLISFADSYLKWDRERSFNIRQAGADLGEILGENAVICGPIAPTLLLENNLRGMIYAVGISDADPDLFRKYPVTHIAVDVGASGAMIDRFPVFASAETVAEYWIRDTKILFVRIAGLTGSEEAASYQMTDYEKGRRFKDQQAFDSAQVYFERFAERFPENKSVLLALGDVYPFNRRLDDGLEALRSASKLYPDDFYVLMALAVYYQTRSVATGEKEYLSLARVTYRKVLEKNPYHWDEIKSISGKIMSFR
ncbi:MAG: hypothetical protein JSU69_00555 [Candidatus Zixiibacteriota bacterium]|nr:MAG: hypothetical protein JSU69_00555 [candidate division Zixibacteria bacterium]